MAAISSAPQRHDALASFTRRHPWTIRLLLTLISMVCDAVAVNTAVVGVYVIRFGLESLRAMLFNSDPRPVLLFMGLLNIAFLLTFSTSGLYAGKRGVSRVDEGFKIVVAVSLGTFAAIIIHYLYLQPLLGRDLVEVNTTFVVLSWLAAILATVIMRQIYRSLLFTARQRGFDNRRVLIIGAEEPGQVVYNTIQRAPELGYRVQGFLSDTTPVGTLVNGTPVLGRTASLGRVIRLTTADEVIVALSGRPSSEVLDIVALAEDEAVDIKLYPDAFQLITNNEVSVGDVSGLPLISVKNVALDSPFNQALKRGLDVVFSALVLTFTSPIMLLIALLIRLDSPGPVFFVQERVGLDGKLFPCIKFRGMVRDAPDRGSWTVANDPRVTAVGAFLRRYSLDELPQFINVLRGEMSIVGPRPEQPVWVERFSQRIPRYVRRHKQKAGITGWAQVNGLRGDSSIEERTRYDLYYVENWSLLFDIKIIIKTAVDVLVGRNNGY